MNPKIGMTVANVLYPPVTDPHENNEEALWAVMSDSEQDLCIRIAKAVLLEIRKPSQEMLSAADGDIAALLDSLNQRGSSNTGSNDIIATAFTPMIDEVIGKSNGIARQEPTS